ncbi:signal peptidase II [Roseisalinus antarcticus]|uniref:Lipoprotein signal peptidase n=1 Tax=Roseisalinus antarcticus TaxID=254357 RepID=A0A1Y5SLL6_9RHOB|nr:signal peptidase II [Roseisalinus antarcticus]SLN43447.1 Lipoprotein signal peptidase [Roseisalinus antarcticus]
MRVTYWTAFWVFLIDQATKWIVVHGMDLMTRMVIDVVPPLLTFRMAWNRGVNFGLFAGFDARWLLVGIAVAVSAFVLVWIGREGGSRMTYLSAGLLVGGAMGNVVDRVLYGAVADFINMSCCGINNPFAFNVADMGVFAGALGLVIFTGRGSGAGNGKRRNSA